MNISQNLTWKHFSQYLKSGLLFSDLHCTQVQKSVRPNLESSKELLSDSSPSVAHFSKELSQIAAAIAADVMKSYKKTSNN